MRASKGIGGALTALVCGSLLASTATAQTLRERIAERRLERAMQASGETGRASESAGVRILRDLHYGTDADQVLDAYLPPSPVHAAPVLLMVHGGGWRIGDKVSADVVQNKVARWVPRGIIVVSVNYRMLPTPVSTQVDDVAHALAFAQKQATAWGGDPKHFVLMGHSAGAHLVDVLTADPARAYAAGAQPWLGTVSLDSAAVDVPTLMKRRHAALYDAAFGDDPTTWRSLSPIDLLTSAAPPLLAVCSSERRDDPCAPTRRFVERAHSLGVRAEIAPQPLSHMQINALAGAPGAHTERIEAFMATLDPSLKAALAAH